ncbi:MMPL family transporter [Photobacterium sagamiensis]|uniref:MMPL family transporter n=1 Tax=Photobacterium sagamiensis TaxID=2910241 RepID=UPI003D0F2AD7
MPSNSKLAAVWLLIVLLLAGVLGYQLTASHQSPIETNILALLPENRQDPIAQQAFDQVADSMSNKVIFLIGSKDQTQVVTAAEQFSTQLSTLGMFSDVTGKLSQNLQQAWGQLYFPKRFQLLTPEQKTRLQGAPEQQVQRVIQALYNPFSGITGTELKSDPFLLFRDFLAQLTAQSGSFKLTNGFLTSSYQDKEYVLITADLTDSAYNLALQQQLPELAALEDQIRQQFAVDVLHTGVIFYAAHGTESAKSEISTIGFGSLLGIIVLLLVVYRSPLPLVLALLSITCGLLAAFVLTVAIFGKVHLFSLVFGASLIGVSIDYAFHFLTDRLAEGNNWNARRGLQHIFVAITLGLITSLIGYLGMLIAPFPGLQQLSLFSAFGLTAAYATVVCWYPILARKPSQPCTLPMTSLMTTWLAMWQKPAVRIALPSVLLLASLVGIYHTSYNDDIRQLQALPADLKQQEETIKTITGVSHSQQMLLVKATDEQALLEQLNQVTDQLDTMTASNTSLEQAVLDGYQSISQYLPSEQTQRDNFRLIRQLYQQQGAALTQQLNLNTNVKLDHDFSPLTINEFLASPVSAPLRFMWLGKLSNQQAAIILLSGVSNPQALQQFAAQHPALSYLDKADEVSSLFGEYRIRVTELLVAATGAILALLVWRYGLKQGILLIVPPVIAGCVGIAVTAITGMPLNLFNLLALILILGIGIDYTVFFAEQTQAKSTLLAISLSAATTLLSFGLLALSATQAIHSFGITVLTGIMVAWLLAPLSMPQLASHTDEVDG